MRISEKILTLRREKGWSQEKLGEMLGLSRQAVSKWEAGSAAPTVDNLIELARVFGVSVDELLETGHPGADASADATALPEDTSVSAAGVRALFAEFAAAQDKRARRQFMMAASGGVLLGALIIGAVIFGYAYRRTVDELRTQIASVSGQVGGVSASVYGQIDELRRTLEEQLTRQESIMADYSWSVQAIEPTTDRATLRVEAMPKAYHEGMQLVFAAAADGFESVEAVAEEGTGHRFSAVLTVPLAREIRLSATVNGENNQLLETVTDLRAQHISTQTVEIYFGYSYSSGADTAEVSPEISVTTQSAYDANDALQLIGAPVRAGYQLKLGDELLEEGEITSVTQSEYGALMNAAGQTYQQNLEQRLIPVDRMSELVCTVWLEDETGRRVSARRVCEGLGADRP